MINGNFPEKYSFLPLDEPKIQVTVSELLLMAGLILS